MFGLNTEELTASKVALRPWRTRDLKNFLELKIANAHYLKPFEASDPDVHQISYLKAQKNYFKWAINAHRRDELKAFAIWALRGNSPKIVGEVTLWPLLKGPYSYSRLGYWLANSETKQGYATQAAILATKFSISELGINRVEALVQAENLASKALLQRIAFEYEGVRKNSVYVDSKWRDHEVYAISAGQLAQWLKITAPLLNDTPVISQVK